MKNNSFLSPRLSSYFKEYASFHQTRGNQTCHYFGITLIVVSLLGLFWSLPLGPTALTGSDLIRLDGGTLLLALGCLWYLFLDWKITLPFGLVLLGLYFLGRAIPTPLNWVLFILGWILQGVGHAVFEKKSPAFFRNFTHLLIGPLWIFAKVIGYR